MWRHSLSTLRMEQLHWSQDRLDRRRCFVKQFIYTSVENIWICTISWRLLGCYIIAICDGLYIGVQVQFCIKTPGTISPTLHAYFPTRHGYACQYETAGQWVLIPLSRVYLTKKNMNGITDAMAYSFRLRGRRLKLLSGCTVGNPSQWLGYCCMKGQSFSY